LRWQIWVALNLASENPNSIRKTVKVAALWVNGRTKLIQGRTEHSQLPLTNRHEEQAGLPAQGFVPLMKYTETQSCETPDN
jgi:hypothetical protein